MSALTLISRNKMFNGSHERYRHFSDANQCGMTFAVYLPPQALQGYRVPVLYWLSGLTCTDENFSTKSGAQRFAAQWGIALVMPDTSPRGAGVADDAADNLGQGAGFYLNATREPWAANYQMYSYIVAGFNRSTFPSERFTQHRWPQHGRSRRFADCTEKPRALCGGFRFRTDCQPEPNAVGPESLCRLFGRQSRTMGAIRPGRACQNCR